MSRFLLLILLYCFSIIFISPSYAKKLALVIGNDDYQSIGKLNKAVNDSKAVAEALRSLGFDVTHLKNINNQSMNLAIFGNFVPRISKGDEVVFYYAGHGVEIRNRNYLLATDIPRVKPNNERVIIKGGFAVDEIMQAIEENGSQIALLILDACRNNPFPKTGRRSVGASRGLGRSDPPKGTFVMYSAGARQEALDALSENDTNQNSVFTRKLIPLLKTPGLSLNAMAKRLRGEVERLAMTVSHDQFPAYYDQLRGQYYLAGRGSGRKQTPDEVIALKQRLAALEERLKQQGERKKKEPQVAIGVFDKPVRKDKFVHGYKFDDCNGADWCPKMIVVRGDTFKMGSPEDNKDGWTYERPQHEVKIKKFAVGQYEVTRGEFHKFVQETNYNMGNKCTTFENEKLKLRSNRNYLNPGFSQKDDHPVACANWDDAKAYVKWLSKKTGKNYRLLTEAEWEYAAGAKRSTAFWWGNSISTDQANYYGYDTTFNGNLTGIYRRKTVAVDSFRANPFGLYNVHGNVLEWVEDCWHENYHNAPADGSAWANDNGGNCSSRGARGGSWNVGPRSLRTRTRFDYDKGLRISLAGFRIARSLD